MTDSIPLFEISWDINDVKNVVDSVGRGGYWAKGPYIDEFENKLASYLDVEHALVVNSGTTAIHAILESLSLESTDEVIVPSFTQQATVNAVRLAGATPVFADIETETYGLDPDAVRNTLTDRTKAILPVHVYGSVCRIDELRTIADEHELTLVEDAAEALGAHRDGVYAGTVGDAAALSFCQNKIVATGEGGAVVTDDDDIAARVKLFRSHGRTSTDYFDSAKSGRHVSVGGNYRMPDIVAALGVSQMEKIESLIEGRRQAATEMNDAFEQIPGVTPHTLENGRHVYQFYTVTFDEAIDRDAVIEILSKRGISSKVYWDPSVHQSDYYCDRHSDVELPVTERISGQVLSLPIHPELSPEETARVIEGVADACEELYK
ncbi:DegT/DnrJ/EryC1/StrS family aminotransferase [Halomicrobium sp. IBSBa]|uniref:DegT/DnrJ/EryC1/StrS family aminotransferase n=1 Tax=Halomicrobium sp. IBSBa TaxID=2778916 RepID=UPI001ABFCF8D|nr:DegT/DnrJ/EryC1/StrS family aminotransferase [Halomicrobium sp. IBSBa]MBO4249535.1 DegT/DnrJ/EryC1/StrS family aminotransferase [Halomicrobium sp. IBSBa]